MSKNTIVFMIMAMFIASLFPAVVHADKVPITIQKVWIDGRELSLNEVRGDILRGSQLSVEVKLFASANSDDVQVSAELSGYEHSNNEKVSDKSDTFEVKTDQVYFKQLKLQLPRNLDQDRYAIRIEVSDRRNDKVVFNAILDINTARHDVLIKDVLFSPGLTVKAGRSLLSNVRVENNGEREEDDVKVTLSIPELGVSDSDFLDEVEDDDEKSSEELFVRIPDCAKPGDYKAWVTVNFDDGYKTDKKEYTIKVLENENCRKAEERTRIGINPETPNLVAGGSEAIYPVTLTNAGTESKTYTLEVSAGDWAASRVSPNTVVVGPGETKVAQVSVTAKKDAQPGEKLVSVAVKSNDKVLKELTLKANVVAAKPKSNLTRNLLISIVFLLLVLVIFAVVFAMSRMRSKEEEETKEEETYY